MNKENIWSLLKKFVIEKIGQNDFDLWFKTIEMIRINENEIILGIDNSFKRDWILNNYTRPLKEAIGLCFEKEMRFSFEIVKTNNEIKQDLPAYIQNIRSQQNFYLNPEYTFDHLSVGSFNEIAVTYARHLANNPEDNSVNPLFIYGGVGLGKTHIIQAIGNYIKKIDPGKYIAYTTMEGFTNDLVKSMKSNEMIKFKEKYESLDMFFVDDIQFISGKSGMQEQFFHLFNNLYNKGKIIVMTADKSIREIRDVEERLVSRFQSGQSLEITMPTEIDRMSILRSISQSYSYSIGSDILYYLSQNITTNVRDLITAIKRITVREKMLNMKLNLMDIKGLLRDMISSDLLNIDIILKEVSMFFDVRLSEITSTKRTKHVLIPRQTAMYLMKTILHMSYTSIAGEFGGKDHTTVINSVRKIEKLKNEDNDFKVKFEKLKNRLLNAG